MDHSPRTERIFGLDVMRGTAGIMVVLAHTSHLLGGHWPWLPQLFSFDWVELFFVLSGYLIGGMLLDSLQGTGAPGIRCIDFLQRRWLRSLPNYHLFLVINLALVAWGLAPGMIGDRTWTYAVFLQNFHVPVDYFFWESWSLAVEEWFYLLFPIIAFGLMALARVPSRAAYLITCALFILGPVLARHLVSGAVTDDLTWELHIRKLVITRLDAPGWGMLFLWLHRTYPGQWTRRRWPLFIVGVLMLVFTETVTYVEAPFFKTILLESVLPIGVALLLPVLATWHHGGAWAGPVRQVSMNSFAMYLVHLPVMYLFGRHITQAAPWAAAAGYVLLLVAVYLVSRLVFLYWERPIMRLRDPLSRWLLR